MSYQCKHCLEEFESRFVMANHVKRVHSKPKSHKKRVVGNITCPLCNVGGYKSVSGMHHHMTMMHKPSPKQEEIKKPRKIRVFSAPDTNSCTPRFCPCCGTNLEVVSKALEIAGGLR